MFSLMQLECFIAVAEELHFGAAADRLRMTQPPLSRQIQQLEKELGTRVFDRSSRRVTLTEAGRALLPNARRLIDLSARTVADVRSVGAGVAGTLTVAYTAMAGQSVLPAFVREAAKQLPDVVLRLREMVTVDQLDEIEKGTVDIGLMRPLLGREGMHNRLIHEERLVLAIPADSPLAADDTPISLADLSGQPLLMYSRGGASYFHDLLMTMFVAARVQPNIVQYAGQVPALLALVSAGLGYSIVPESARSLAPATVVLRDLADDDGAADANHVRLEAVWSADGASPLVQTALTVIASLPMTVQPAAASAKIDAKPA